MPKRIKKKDLSNPKYNDFIPPRQKKGRNIGPDRRPWKVAYYALKGWVWRHCDVNPPDILGIERTEPPAKRGRKSDSIFGRALAAEYYKKKAGGEKHGNILKQLQVHAEKGRMKNFRGKRVVTTSAIWNAIKKYR
ncbi:MAG: hypothetical protein WC732_01845 [Candidatus Omnitrophota bacterium]